MGARLDRTPLKILHIDPERRWGGGETQVLGLADYLSRRGHRNHLLAHPEGPLFAAARARAITTLPLRLRNDLDLRPVPGLRRRIRDEKYDIVHFHTKRAHVLSLWCPRGGRRPKYVVTRRMDYPERRRWIARHLYNRRVDGVVAISEPIADLLSAAGVESRKLRVIHSGIDPALYQSRRRRTGAYAGPMVIGTAAVLEERKGHRFLLEAAALLKGRGYRVELRFAGEGSLKADLESRAHRLDLKRDIVFYGFLADIPGFLSELDIFVLPSLSEGLGVSALEAMAAGLPVVASRVGGLADIVVDSITGFVIPPGDAGALTGALARLADDKAEAEAMGERGAARVREHFSMEQMAKKNEDYYYALLSESEDRVGISEKGGSRDE